MRPLYKVLIILSLGLSAIGAKAQTDTLHSHIEVMGNCNMCATRIHDIVDAFEGIYDFEWSAEDHILHIDHDSSLEIHDVHTALSEVGHQTNFMLANTDAFIKLPACCRYTTEEMQDSFQSIGKIIHTDIFVDGACGMCQDRIENIARSHKHIVNVFWDVDEKLLHLDHGAKLQINNLQRKIARGGHDTEFMRAPNWAYDQLHACCKYREEEIVLDETDSETIETDEYVLQGYILEADNAGNQSPVIGANIYWSGTTLGSTTDIEGYFTLDKTAESQALVVSYVGYENDTLVIEDQAYVEILLKDAAYMREVVITHKRRSTDVSMISAIKMQQIGEKELLKAACCNLSESFETNPTVDASMTDAVTGTRQIKMLGLAGPNIQITREGIPDVRGLSALYGLNFTPGTWIRGININTGAGSVVNGYESLVGQIDVSLHQPPVMNERFFVNLYGNEMSRMEGNIHATHSFNDRVSTAALLHGSIIPQRHDNNNDGFLDHPIAEQYVALNRWKFFGNNGLEGQFGVKVSGMSNQSGQVDFDHDLPRQSQQAWGADINLKKYEAWAKGGIVFPSMPYASIGTQFSISYFDQESYFGRRDYDGDETSFYGNIIFQSRIKDQRHPLKAGISLRSDAINEYLSDVTYERRETIPGAFFEYAYKPDERFSLVFGLRGDHHNQFGFFATPRLHMRYAPNEKTVFRLSGGRGQRTASIFAENVGMFASSRKVNVISDGNADTPYGLDAEVAWTFGGSFVKEFDIQQRPLLFQFDVYRTSFENQIVIDYDASPQLVEIYNLDGDSYSNSIQIQVDYEIMLKFDVRLAYRYNDVKTTYSHGKLQRPLTSRDRAFLNVQYQTLTGWSFDFTQNWQSKKRLPSTSSNPALYQLPEYSEDYFMSNFQITKSWNEMLDIYVGAVNAFDYQQPDPILSPDNPFSDYFDGSIIWAPVFGREFYAGLRYRIK